MAGQEGGGGVAEGGVGEWLEGVWRQVRHRVRRVDVGVRRGGDGGQDGEPRQLGGGRGRGLQQRRLVGDLGLRAEAAGAAGE